MKDSQLYKETNESGLHLSTHLQLPLDALTNVLGIVAQRGAGKSYTAGVEMEEMVERGLFVGYIDPLGIAWGIRSSADGENAGLPVLIFGGRHGDIPLDPAAGRVVCQFILQERQPFIIDLSLFSNEDQQCQFVADFIEGFRTHEEVLLHLIIDEADIFAPQIPRSQQRQHSLNAMNQLTRRFRYKGMGATLITQRPAELHKSVLGQIDLLLALRVVSPQDVNALDEWIKRNASADERSQFLATLSGLTTGTAWAWSPQWLHLFRKVAIRTRKTYDSSATPKVGAKQIAPKQIAEINLSHLSAQMEALFEKVRENDPVLLNARIRELEDELRRVREEHPRPPRLSTRQARTESHIIEDLTQKLRKVEEEKLVLQAELTSTQSILEEKERQIASQGATNTQQIQAEGLHAANVNFEQAEIHQFYAGVGIQREGVDGKDEVISQVEVSPIEAQLEAIVDAEPLQHLLFSERKSLDKLISQMRNLNSSEKTLCIWLLEHDEQEISSQELADAVNLDVSVTWSRSTEKLVKLPFIIRKGKSKFHYQATFAAYARRYFSSLSDASLLLQELVKAAHS